MTGQFQEESDILYRIDTVITARVKEKPKKKLTNVAN